MRKFELRAYTPALMLVLGCVLVFHGTRDQVAVPLAAPISGVLDHVDGYRIEEQHVSDEERRVAGMTDYVARIYWRPDSSVAFTTYVGYYDQQTQGKSMHSPKNCLPGAGWEILRGGTATVTAAHGAHVVNRYLLKNGALEAVVYYWYQGRGRVVASEYAVKVNLLKDAALKGHTEEALVRIVIPVDPGDSTQAKADQLGMQIAPRLMDQVQGILPNDGAPAGKEQLAQRQSLLSHPKAWKSIL
jgi:EpsI family protein